MRSLLIDDVRNLPASYTARTFSEGIAAIKDLGPWDALLLDHDLSSFDTEGNEKTGYHVILFLEKHPECRPKKVRLITDNPVGRERMAAGLKAIGYYQLSPIDFELPNA